MIVMSYGDLPTFESFSEAFERGCPSGTFKAKASPLHDLFESVAGSGLDVPAGLTVEYPVKRLWRLVNELTAIWMDEDDEEAGQEASTILGLLGFEWV